MPDYRAQGIMAPEPRPGMKPFSEVEHSCRKAGVLLLLYPHKSRLNLVLTRRTDGLDNHRNQISLPGGQIEAEETAQEAAIRETEEELGVPGKLFRSLGSLTPLYIPPSHFCIYPTVAFSPEKPDFKPCHREVSDVIEIPIRHLLDRKNSRRENRMIRGIETNVPFYIFNECRIWGATAMVLSEFLVILKGSGDPRDTISPKNQCLNDGS